MNTMKGALIALAVASLAAPVQSHAAGFADPLDTPAMMSPLASTSLLQGVARAGLRLVAVGQRGHIVVSSDSGTTWKQSKVPVSSDLTAVFFANDQNGWAVGHDGVILHTGDGGESWTLQLDGPRANERLVQHMQERATATTTAENKQLLDDAKRFKDQGADKPFLDVWFADDKNGYVVGAYNLIFRTKDGGKNWEPLFDQTDNPKLFNLYAIRAVGGSLYVAGEGGLMLKLDAGTQRFRALDVPYKGSFFGVVGDKSAVIAFGLRGNAFTSTDGGKTWAKADVGLPATIVAGSLTASGAFVLADVGGRIVGSDDGGKSFKKIPVEKPMPIAGIADAGNGRLAIAGPRGVALTQLGAK